MDATTFTLNCKFILEIFAEFILETALSYFLDD
jgi:hypothetical protein